MMPFEELNDKIKWMIRKLDGIQSPMCVFRKTFTREVSFLETRDREFFPKGWDGPWPTLKVGDVVHIKTPPRFFIRPGSPSSN